jgi:hypothetical protein
VTAQLLAGSGTNSIVFLNAAGLDIDDGATGLSHAALPAATAASSTIPMRRVIARTSCSMIARRARRRLCESGTVGAR